MPMTTRKLSNWLDKGSFLIAFLFGAGWIVGLKLQEGWSPWVVTIPLLLWMISYAGYIVWVSPYYRLQEDRAGDSLYYLGFLYTLISLACSLYAFKQNDQATQVIISNFGTALATTILGLALRVVLNQMREDPVDIERETRVELSEAVDRLRTELDRAVIEFNSFWRAIVQSVTDGLNNAVIEFNSSRRATAQSIAEGLEEITSRVNTTLTDSTTRYTDVATDVVEKINKVFAEFEAYSINQNRTANRIVTATERLLARIERIEVPSDLLETKLAPAFGALQTSVEQTIERIERIEVPTDLLKKKFDPTFDMLLASVQQTVEKCEKTLTPRINELLTSVHQAIDRTKAEMDYIVQLQQRIHEAAKSSEEEMETARTHRQALEEELKTSRELVGKVHTSLVSMTSLVVEKLNGR